MRYTVKQLETELIDQCATNLSMYSWEDQLRLMRHPGYSVMFAVDEDYCDNVTQSGLLELIYFLLHITVELGAKAAYPLYGCLRREQAEIVAQEEKARANGTYGTPAFGMWR